MSNLRECTAIFHTTLKNSILSHDIYKGETICGMCDGDNLRFERDGEIFTVTHIYDYAFVKYDDEDIL